MKDSTPQHPRPGFEQDERDTGTSGVAVTGLPEELCAFSLARIQIFVAVCQAYNAQARASNGSSSCAATMLYMELCCIVVTRPRQCNCGARKP